LKVADTTELLPSERQPCEVWTRVMGYHRPVSSLNAVLFCLAEEDLGDTDRFKLQIDIRIYLIYSLCTIKKIPNGGAISQSS
jgi:hypothetical protein